MVISGYITHWKAESALLLCWKSRPGPASRDMGSRSLMKMGHYESSLGAGLWTTSWMDLSKQVTVQYKRGKPTSPNHRCMKAIMFQGPQFRFYVRFGEINGPTKPNNHWFYVSFVAYLVRWKVGPPLAFSQERVLWELVNKQEKNFDGSAAKEEAMGRPDGRTSAAVLFILSCCASLFSCLPSCLWILWVGYLSNQTSWSVSRSQNLWWLIIAVLFCKATKKKQMGYAGIIVFTTWSPQWWSSMRGWDCSL